MEEKTIQAVELVRQIRDQQYEITKDMSNEELLDFFHREAAAANAQIEHLIPGQNRRTRYA